MTTGCVKRQRHNRAVAKLEFMKAGTSGSGLPPPLFFLITAGILAAYLLAVQAAKRWFYSHLVLN